MQSNPECPKPPLAMGASRRDAQPCAGHTLESMHGAAAGETSEEQIVRGQCGTWWRPLAGYLARLPWLYPWGYRCTLAVSYLLLGMCAFFITEVAESALCHSCCRPGGTAGFWCCLLALQCCQ